MRPARCLILLAIRDLLIDPRTGKVEYLALGRAGGSGQEELPLYPVSALRSGGPPAP